MHSKIVAVPGFCILAIACGGAPDERTASTQSSVVSGALAVIPNLTPTPTFSDSTVPVEGSGKGT